MHEPGPGAGDAPGSKSDSYTQRLEDSFIKMEKNADRAVRNFQRLATKINEASQYSIPVAAAAAPFTGGTSMLAPAALYLVEKHLDEIWAYLQKLIKRVKYALKHETPVVSLVYTSFAWLDDAMSPLSDIAGDAKRHADWGVLGWKADAATAYAGIKADQVAALQEVTRRAEGVSAWLKNVAAANMDYLSKLASVVFDVAAELGSAVAEISTVVEAPWGIDTLADAIAKLVAGFFKQAVEYAKKLVNTLGNVRELYSLRKNTEYFPGGKWPQAVTL